MQRENSRLTPSARATRLTAIAIMGTFAAALRNVDPTNASRWLPTSCGAVTGVPCVFCGTTRALHYLLNGDLARALYFNWLAFPLAVGAAVVAIRAAVEFCSAKRVIRLRAVRVTPRVIMLSLAALALTWLLQVYLAISQHKTELLNPRGPLYALLVR